MTFLYLVLVSNEWGYVYFVYNKFNYSTINVFEYFRLSAKLKSLFNLFVGHALKIMSEVLNKCNSMHAGL